MLEGLRTLVCPVADLSAAKAWYAELLGVGPYFDEPFYVGFSVGGYDLGLVPAEGSSNEGSITYWGVADADAAYEALLARGASPQSPVRDVGGGIRLGAVMDPFGSVLGVIHNPQFLAAHAETEPDETGPGLTFSLHIPQMVVAQARSGAQSAGVSLEEYIGECALDGLYRGYR